MQRSGQQTLAGQKNIQIKLSGGLVYAICLSVVSGPVSFLIIADSSEGPALPDALPTELRRTLEARCTVQVNHPLQMSRAALPLSQAAPYWVMPRRSK